MERTHSEEETSRAAAVCDSIGRYTEAGRMLYSLYNLRKHNLYSPKVKVRTDSKGPLPQEQHRAKIRAKYEQEKAKRSSVDAPYPLKRRTYKPPKFTPGTGKRNSASIHRQMRTDREAMSEPPLYRPTVPREKQIKDFQDSLSGTKKEGKSKNSKPQQRKDTKSARELFEHEKLQIRFDEVSNEIAERREFLQKMKQLGEGDAYSAKIRAEIAERLQELRRIDARLKKVKNAP